MLRINIYIPEDLKRRINFTAKAKKRPESEVIREALEEGMKVVQPKTSSAQSLLDFAEKAKAIPTQGSVPADAIKNLDFYTWGGSKRE